MSPCPWAAASVVRNPFGPWLNSSKNKTAWRKRFTLFQILVTWVIISDWPRRDSWQHFYTRGLPTKKLQATMPTSLSTSHTLQIFIQSCLSFKRTGAWGKSWSCFYLPTKHLDKTSSKHLDNSFHIPPLFWDAKHKGTLTKRVRQISFKGIQCIKQNGG